jgi:putative transposase
MPHSHSCCLLHVVFAVAERRSLIPEDVRERLHSYIGGIARERGLHALAVGGTADHIHLLISLPRTISLANAIQVLKGNSSKWIRDTFPNMTKFSWQEGYGAFSIGVSQRDVTVQYIKTQREHHQRYSFDEEMTKFLAVHAMVGQLESSESRRDGKKIAQDFSPG